MEIRKYNGKDIVCGYIFPVTEIRAGQQWMGGSGAIVEVVDVVGDDVIYSWLETGVRKINDKSSFSFQCRYSLIVDYENYINTINNTTET